MATLSQKATDGRLSFTKYVTDNKRYAEIEFDIEKGMKTPLYVKRGNDFVASSKEYSSGAKFKIINNRLIDPDGLRFAEVLISGQKGYFPITKIRKPTNVNSTAYEDEVVDAINDFILSNGGVLDFKIGNKIYPKMSYAIKVETKIKQAGGVRGDPKADIIICADKDKPLVKGSVFISHKKDGGPEAFQQYGGLSAQAGVEIYGHVESQKFLQDIAGLLGGSNQLPRPVMMKVIDKRLINLSIFGPEFGKEFSLQHVQLIGQGKPTLKIDSSGICELKFGSNGDKMSISGDLSHFVGGYTPVFGATFRAGRGFDFNGKRYDGARVGIYPEKLIATRSNILIL